MFIPAIASQNIMTGNISVFKDLNINQLGLKKKDPRFGKLFIIWWGDLKTEMQMLSIQELSIGIDWAYNYHQSIFLGLVL